jgi:uncharacterized DUF497 family protein
VFKDADGFDWDDGNRDKATTHGVSHKEIEDVFRGPLRVFPDDTHSQSETRFFAIGANNAGREIFVSFTQRVKGGMRLIRPISARFMHRDEVEHYETQTEDSETTADAKV